MGSLRTRHRLSYSRVVFALLLCALAGGVLLARGFAQNEPRVEEEPFAQPATPRPAVVPGEPGDLRQAILKEIELERAQHAARLKRLQTVREALVKAGAPAADLEEIDAAIADERADFAARLATLTRWSRVRGVEGDPRIAPVNEELREFGRAMRRINQSYAIAPVVGKHAASGGSSYVDPRARERDRAEEPYEEPRQPAPGAPALPPGDGERDADAAGILPPPVVVGSQDLPAWVYGERSLVRGPMTNPKFAARADVVIRELVESVRVLRAEVERLESRVEALEGRE